VSRQSRLAASKGLPCYTILYLYLTPLHQHPPRHSPQFLATHSQRLFDPMAWCLVTLVREASQCLNRLLDVILQQALSEHLE
jgi:hypothetical protein